MSEQSKSHTFTVLPSYIEKMRDFVYFKKVNGDPYYTQGDLLKEALDVFFDSINSEILPRPERVKELERKRTGRRKRD